MGKLTKEEIEQELINMAVIRWELRKNDPDYKKAFDNFVLDLNSKDTKGDYRDWSDNSVYFENFPMLPKESIDDFKRRFDFMLDNPNLNLTFATECFSLYEKDNLKKFTSYKCDELEVINDEYTISYPAIEIERRWKIKPPVDPRVEHLNPWSLESLIYQPVISLGYAPLDPSEELHTTDINIILDRMSNSKKIILEIDLEQDIKHIKHRINQIISKEKKRMLKVGLIQDTKDHLEVIGKAIKAYRLRNEGEVWEDIAKDIFPEDFKDPLTLPETDPDPNPESALAKVQQYYKRAEELIREGL